MCLVFFVFFVLQSGCKGIQPANLEIHSHFALQLDTHGITWLFCSS